MAVARMAADSDRDSARPGPGSARTRHSATLVAHTGGKHQSMFKSHVYRSLLAASALCMASVLPAAAQSAPPQQNAPAPSAVDRMDLVKLTVRQPNADAPADHVQFEAT